MLPQFSQNRRAWEAGERLLPGHFPCASPSPSEAVKGQLLITSRLPMRLWLSARPTQAMKWRRGCMELTPQLHVTHRPCCGLVPSASRTSFRVEGPRSDTLATLAFTVHVSNKWSDASSLDGTLPGSHGMTYATVPRPDARGHQWG